MMCEDLVMTCRPTLLVLLGLTLLHGSSSASYVEEPVNCPTQKQMTIPDVLFFVNQTVSTIEATAEEVKQLKKRLDGMDVLLKSPDKPVEKEQTETEFFLFTEVKKNWFEAYEDCRIKGMALASIENDEDHWNMTEQIIALGRISKLPVNRHEKLIFKKHVGQNVYILSNFSNAIFSQLQKEQFLKPITYRDMTLSTNWGGFWLSGTDLGHEGKFVWMSTGRPVTVNLWILGEPDHSQICDGSQKEHCIEIKQPYIIYSMNDWCCEMRQNYICERRKINQ